MSDSECMRIHVLDLSDKHAPKRATSGTTGLGQGVLMLLCPEAQRFSTDAWCCNSIQDFEEQCIGAVCA